MNGLATWQPSETEKERIHRLPKSEIKEEILFQPYKNLKEFGSSIMNNSTCPNKLDNLDGWTTLN